MDSCEGLVILFQM